MSTAIFQPLMQNHNTRECVGILRVFSSNNPYDIRYPKSYKFFTVLHLKNGVGTLHGGSHLKIVHSDMRAMRLEAGRLGAFYLAWTHNGKKRQCLTIIPFPSIDEGSFDLCDMESSL
jgi:hypothetical protein